MSLVAATWAEAGVTLLLVVVAALTARFAVMAFRKQAEEVAAAGTAIGEARDIATRLGGQPLLDRAASMTPAGTPVSA